MANLEHLALINQGVIAWNKWRAEFPQIKPDLSEAYLGHAHLLNVNLAGTNLSGANLNNVHLVDADLRAANLQGANLRFATLLRANLRKATLVGADLYCTHFWCSYLLPVDFTEAIFGYTVFSYVDLSQAKGLESARHTGPSTIGVDTIYSSDGKIPELFLRAAGVPDEILDVISSIRAGPPIQFYSCFISYSHENKAFAGLLHDRLQGQGIRCWLDEHQLLPGDDLHDVIDQGIRLWDKVLLCASKSSLASWWVDGEINRAFQKEAQIMKERGKKVLALIPLNLDGFLFSADYQSGKKAEIKSRIAANFVGWEKDHALFDREFAKVIRALKTEDAGREKPPASRL